VNVIDRVLAALNAHDLERFVGCYAPEATIEDGYDTVFAHGHAELREKYGAMFDQLPELRVEPGRRTAVGEFVVQEESVIGRGDPLDQVAVYLVRDDLIVRERLLR
jgi:hypothetical protein